MNNNILIVSLIIIVILLVVAVNMLSDMYTNKSKKKEGFANIADDPSESKLNNFLNKDKEQFLAHQYSNNTHYDPMMSRLEAKRVLDLPNDFNINNYKLKTEPDDIGIDLKDYVLKSSIPPATKCPACVCPKVSVLAGVSADEGACPPCPVQRCPKPPQIEIPKCPPPTVCPAPAPCPENVSKIYVSAAPDDSHSDQNLVDWLRKALDAGDSGDLETMKTNIENAFGVITGNQLNQAGAVALQQEIDKDGGAIQDIRPTMNPNRSQTEGFVNAPETFTVDGKLIR